MSDHRDHPFQTAPYHVALGMRVVETGEGFARMTVEARQEHTQAFDFVHGGFLATLLDAAAACATYESLPRGTPFTSVEYKLNFLRQGKPGRLVAEGRVVKSGRRVLVVEAHVVDADERELARYLGTFIVLES